MILIVQKQELFLYSHELIIILLCATESVLLVSHIARTAVEQMPSQEKASSLW